RQFSTLLTRRSSDLDAQDICAADYNWQRPNRRYSGGDVVLPSLYSKQCGRMAVAVDTSGSCCDEVTLGRFEAAVKAVAADVQPSAIDAYYVDTRGGHTETFEEGEDVKLGPQGRGGADLPRVFA